MKYKVLLWLAAGLAYLLWPLDAVPDFLVLVGWMDDLLLAGLSFYMAWRAFKKKAENAP